MTDSLTSNEPVCPCTFTKSRTIISTDCPVHYTPNEPLTDLHSESWFNIKGRGKCAVIKEQYPDTPADPNTYKGKLVTIDRIPYKVLGVETFAIPRSEERPYTNRFSLLVEATPNEQAGRYDNH